MRRRSTSGTRAARIGPWAGVQWFLPPEIRCQTRVPLDQGGLFLAVRTSFAAAAEVMAEGQVLARLDIEVVNLEDHRAGARGHACLPRLPVRFSSLELQLTDPVECHDVGRMGAKIASMSLARAAFAQSSISSRIWVFLFVLVICTAISVGLMPMNAGASGRKLGILRERIGDLVPGRFRADEYMKGRTDARIVDRRSHPNVKEPAVAHENKQRGAA
jgi:hypothetical protein